MRGIILSDDFCSSRHHQRPGLNRRPPLLAIERLVMSKNIVFAIQFQDGSDGLAIGVFFVALVNKCVKRGDVAPARDLARSCRRA